MSTTIDATPRSGNGVVSLDQWAAYGVHTVNLPSGAVCKIRFPDLGELLRRDLLPERLRSVALQKVFEDVDADTPPETPVPADAAKKTEERVETVKGLMELIDWLVTDMLVEPTVTVEDLPRVPSEDKAMLAAIAQRERHTDAKGVVLGVAPLSMWDSFREVHKCRENCKACEALQRRFSTVHTGGV